MARKFRVQLKPGRGAGEYHRGGRTFSAHIVSTFVPVPIVLDETELNDEIRNDQWLTVTELSENDNVQE